MICMIFRQLTIQREDDSVGVHRGTVVEFHPFPQMEGISEIVVGHIPAGGQGGNDFGGSGFELDKGVENLVCRVERLTIGFPGRIQADRVAGAAENEDAS